MSSKTRSLAQIGLLAAAVYFVGVLLDLHGLRVVTKPIPVLCLLAWLRPLPGADARRLSLGLLLSLVGDVLLESSPALFVPGLVAFLLAHVAYTAAFVGRARAPHLLRLLPIVAYGVLVFRWLEPTLGAMRGPVLAYVFVICAMVWRAFAQVGERRDASAAGLAALGAALFAASDTLVAYCRFIAPSDALQVVLMLLYWAAQLLIAASVERPRGVTL